MPPKKLGRPRLYTAAQARARARARDKERRRRAKQDGYWEPSKRVPCKAEGCHAKARAARGLCWRHYQRQRRAALAPYPAEAAS